jgi:hypothetical protein
MASKKLTNRVFLIGKFYVEIVGHLRNHVVGDFVDDLVCALGAASGRVGLTAKSKQVNRKKEVTIWKS